MLVLIIIIEYFFFLSKNYKNMKIINHTVKKAFNAIYSEKTEIFFCIKIISC